MNARSADGTSARSMFRRVAPIALAAALHVILALLLWAPRLSTPVEPVVEVVLFGELDIVTEEVPAEVPPPSEVHPVERRVASRQAHLAARESFSGAAREAHREATRGEEAVNGTGAEAAADNGPDNGRWWAPKISPGTSPGTPPGGGGNPFYPTRASLAALEKEDQKRQLMFSGTRRDSALGLGPEGPVLSALSSGTSRSLAPVKGRAVFVARADEKGEVYAIELAEGGTGWDDAARVALEELAKKRLRMPSQARGAVMRIEVVSGWQLPSGQDPGVDLSIFGVPITHGEGPNATKVDLLNPLALSALNTNADVSNIGAKPRRIVRTHLLDAQFL